MAGKYQAYSEYKDSGVEWLGNMPKHWKTIPVGRLFYRTKRTNQAEKELLSVYRDYGVIIKSSRDDNNNKPSEDLTPYQLVEPNDLVMNKMKAWQGSIAISEYEGIVSPAYFVYKPWCKLFELAYPKYVHYLLRNPMYIAQYLRQSKGIRINQWDLDPSEFQRIELLLPSKEEQIKIFQFLDHETGKIDGLIEKQRILIKLLKEKRQAVISHAVTKGLNPAAPMKDSGVEWLGDVPEHWEVMPIKAVAKLNPKKSEVSSKLNKSCSFVPMEKLKTGVVLVDEQKNISEVFDGYTYFKNGDVLMAKVTPCFENRNIAIATDLINEIGFGSTEIFVLRANHRVENLFLFYSLQEEAFMSKLTSLMSGAGGLKRVPSEKLDNYKVTMPDRNEQENISKYLDNQTTKIDDLILKAQSAITLMQERRTALISAAVTGKIDVRDWQAPDQTIQNKEQAA